MKRLHVHMSVEDVAQSVKFCSTLFAADPAVIKPDYAKWMLEDPLVNFAISARGREHIGLDHLGIQVENEAELGEVYGRLQVAEGPVLEQGATTCCYHKSEKSWIADQTGFQWEAFLTRGETTVYGDGEFRAAQAAAARDEAPATSATACCTPAPASACFAPPAA
jgi:hypothetical protein